MLQHCFVLLKWLHYVLFNMKSIQKVCHFMCERLCGLCCSCLLPINLLKLICMLSLHSLECSIDFVYALWSFKLICSKKGAAFSVSNAQCAQLYMLNPTKKVCHFMCEPLCGLWCLIGFYAFKRFHMLSNVFIHFQTLSYTFIRFQTLTYAYIRLYTLLYAFTCL